MAVFILLPVKVLSSLHPSFAMLLLPPPAKIAPGLVFILIPFSLHPYLKFVNGLIEILFNKKNCQYFYWQLVIETGQVFDIRMLVIPIEIGLAYSILTFFD